MVDTWLWRGRMQGTSSKSCRQSKLEWPGCRRAVNIIVRLHSGYHCRTSWKATPMQTNASMGHSVVTLLRLPMSLQQCCAGFDRALWSRLLVLFSYRYQISVYTFLIHLSAGRKTTARTVRESGGWTAADALCIPQRYAGVQQQARLFPVHTL